MQSQIEIRNTARGCEIDIEGTIGVPEAWQFDDPGARVATYEKFRDTVRRIAAIDAQEVAVNIRSTGGDVNDALLIYDALRSLRGTVTTRCYGYTASAATIIAQAASDGAREISANARYLIHRSACAAEGNADQMERQLDLLRKTGERLAGVYAARSGRPAEEFAALMAENDGNGRWLSPDETLAAGLADRIVREKTGRTKALAEKIVRNWERLLASTGIRTPAPRPEPGCNILHAPDERPGNRPEILPMPIPAGTGPTRTKPCEDPSVGEPQKTPNELAYAEDALRMGGRA